uniref:E3 ubiquitin-protein ligase MARCHF2 n=2 Tax=Pseudonaja textilis TaxID=8673 RepID=A0A670ZHQ5_PSETE
SSSSASATSRPGGLPISPPRRTPWRFSYLGLCPLFSSDGPICRICHEGGNGEGLLSPCDCTGSLGTVHRSCLEKWLSSSNTSYCELCHTEFMVERRPRPLTEWLKHPGPRNEKRTLFCDMACFLFITPLAAISGWLCLRGAQDHMQFNSHLEAIGLIALTIALFTIYVLWTLVSAHGLGRLASWFPMLAVLATLGGYPSLAGVGVLFLPWVGLQGSELTTSQGSGER